MNSDFPSSLSGRCRASFRRRPRLFCVLCLGLLAIVGPPCAAEEPRFLTLSDFREQLDKPLVVTQEQVPLREFLRNLSANLKIAILLDRRIDPDQRIDVRLNAPFLDEGLRELVKPLKADVTVIADTVFITTPENARTLRTRLALSQSQRDQLTGKDFGRQNALIKKAPLAWEELTQPREMVDRISRQSGLRVRNTELLPYDLWAAGSLAWADSLEALLAVVSQFSLDVEWIDAEQIQLVPAAETPAITRSHSLPRENRENPDQILAQLQQQYPDREFSLSGSHLTVAALLEEHEQIAVALGAQPPRRHLAPLSAENLDNRRFTLPEVRVPFRSLMAMLQQQGIEIRYAAEELEQAGIDLDTRVSLELKDATIHQLLQAACEPLGLSWKVQGVQVELSPKTDSAAQP